MTRDQALHLLRLAERPKEPPVEAHVIEEQHQQFLGNIEALGLIKFEEPPVPVHTVPALVVTPAQPGNGFAQSAEIREDTLVETLRQAGYDVRRRKP